MMMSAGNGQLSVSPGFRFHPTDEELLYYYLRKKVSYEAIDLDVIREVDLNKLEPWDLKEICRIGSGPQNEWYFFSHKDKKYPTGTRTNRATAAGFWKATGRDKAIYLSNSKRIGMRKTLVFYTGRAPHGQKTDWIMHEYRLDDNTAQVEEDGWVVCRVFKKKNYTRGFQHDTGEEHEEHHQLHFTDHMKVGSSSGLTEQPKQNNIQQPHQHCFDYASSFDGSMHLPQLLSPDLSLPCPLPPSSNMNHLECSHHHNLLRLTSAGAAGCSSAFNIPQQHEKFSGDWSFLDKLLASNQGALQSQAATGDLVNPTGAQKYPIFHHHGFDPYLLKFSK